MYYKTPLSVYVIWHPENKEAENFAEALYTILCRDITKPLIRSLGIPVYFRNTKSLAAINFEESTNTVIIPLIDDAFVLDKDFVEFVSSHYDKCLENKVFRRLIPIALTNSAYNISANLKHINFITDKNFSEIKIAVLHQLCRFLLKLEETQEVPPVKLFISHSKHDDKKSVAEKFRDYVNQSTQVKTFFDVNDIQHGSLFEEEIKTAVKESAMVAFQSGTYADREWCRIEVLTAKKYNCPMVIVNAVQLGEQRAFPYLGNFPSIRYESEADFAAIIHLALLQVLKKLFLTKLFEGLANLYPIKKENILTNSPELLDFIRLKEIHNKSNDAYSLFLYPDPPLGTEELEILHQMENKFIFVTPLTLPSITLV